MRVNVWLEREGLGRKMTEANLRIYQAAAKILNTLIENKATNENRPLTYQEVYALIGFLAKHI
jgi:hypothetical protein